jgi:hypothetical protein
MFSRCFGFALTPRFYRKVLRHRLKNALTFGGMPLIL